MEKKMNLQKICFIYCVNNDSQFRQSWSYIQQLTVPNGYVVEKKVVKNATSITSGYNSAMRNSNAKYKVYLHQDVDIINQNFLVEILNIFHLSPRLGMLGVIGAKHLPANGIWWAADRKFGKVYAAGELAFNEVKGIYESVQAIDGLIMVTQYDLYWREDILKGWHFYDISQSLEFIKAGYQVGVPKQKTPWCRHNFGDTDLASYERERLTFIQAYKTELKKTVVVSPKYLR